MNATISAQIFCSALLVLLFLLPCLAVSRVTTTADQHATNDAGVRTLSGSGGKMSATLFFLTGYKPRLAPPPAGPKVVPKAPEVSDRNGPPSIAELPSKPLPQIMLPRNMTAADALKPPLGAAQVAPPPRKLVDVDMCRGYFDVMGHFDSTFNCSKGSYIYCCGTCHYRFCCEYQGNRLDQDACTNYNSPIWAEAQVPDTAPASNTPNPGFETLQQHNSSTAYVIGGVISFTLVVAIGVRIAFSKVSRRPRNRDINMPRSLVDILRHQSSPVQQGDTPLSASASKNLYTPTKLYTPTMQRQDNRKHGPWMNPTPQLSLGLKLMSGSGKGLGAGGGGGIGVSGGGVGGGLRHSSSHASFSHSFHNLAQLPPSYEATIKPETLTRYSSLKRLERELDEYSYYTNRRRLQNAPPSFHSSQYHLPWGGNYTLGSRGTLPLHGSRPRLHMPASTPNPYPLPSPPAHTGPAFDRPPRRVRSQDQLLAVADGNTWSRLSKNQQQQYHKPSRSNNSQTLRRSHERLMVSPDRLENRLEDRLEDRLLTMGLLVGGAERGVGPGMVPTMGRLRPHQKAQSQQNICATPSMDRHHMVKMNSHPTPGHEHEHASGMSVHGGWDHGGGAGSMGHPNARRMAFASKRQNTIEQLHFIPGVGVASGGGGGAQTLRTGSKNEVTV